MSAAVTRSGASRAGFERPHDRVGRTDSLGLPGETDLEPEGGAVTDERLDLLAEMSHHDPDLSEPAGGELPQQRSQHRPSVDRQERFRPPFGERTQATPLPRGHHDGVHQERPVRA